MSANPLVFVYDGDVALATQMMLVAFVSDEDEGEGEGEGVAPQFSHTNARIAPLIPPSASPAPQTLLLQKCPRLHLYLYQQLY